MLSYLEWTGCRNGRGHPGHLPEEGCGFVYSVPLLFWFAKFLEPSLNTATTNPQNNILEMRKLKLSICCR